MPNSLLVQQIESDIAEAERLIAELRFHIALTQSAGDDTSENEARLHRMLMVSMLLRDQRLKTAAEAPIIIEQGEPDRSVRLSNAVPQSEQLPASEDQP